MLPRRAGSGSCRARGEPPVSVSARVRIHLAVGIARSQRVHPIPTLENEAVAWTTLDNGAYQNADCRDADD